MLFMSAALMLAANAAGAQIAHCFHQMRE